MRSENKIYNSCVNLGGEKGVPLFLFLLTCLLVTRNNLSATVPHVSVMQIRTYKNIRRLLYVRWPFNFSRRAWRQDCKVTELTVFFYATSPSWICSAWIWICEWFGLLCRPESRQKILVWSVKEDLWILNKYYFLISDAMLGLWNPAIIRCW